MDGASPPAAPPRLRVGAAGEAAAVAHLRSSGMRILEVDWRCRLGQIDIVALDGATVVIVEVKARRTASYGPPQEAVDARKRRKLVALAETYRIAHGRLGQPCRIDVVGVLLDRSLVVRHCEHIRDAVGAA